MRILKILNEHPFQTLPLILRGEQTRTGISDALLMKASEYGRKASQFIELNLKTPQLKLKSNLDAQEGATYASIVKL